VSRTRDVREGRRLKKTLVVKKVQAQKETRPHPQIGKEKERGPLFLKGDTLHYKNLPLAEKKKGGESPDRKKKEADRLG